MTFLDEPAREAALRHGRWQMVLLIVSFAVIGTLLVVDPAAVGASDGELPRTISPWSATLVGLVVAWALVLVGLLVRHRVAIPTDPAARSAFATASVSVLVFPLAPGVLLWFAFGLPASVIGLGCLVATLWLNPPSRPALRGGGDATPASLARLHTSGLLVLTVAGFLGVGAAALALKGSDDAWGTIQPWVAVVGVPLTLWAILLTWVVLRARRDPQHHVGSRAAVRRRAGCRSSCRPCRPWPSHGGRSPASWRAWSRWWQPRPDALRTAGRPPFGCGRGGAGRTWCGCRASAAPSRARG